MLVLVITVVVKAVNQKYQKFCPKCGGELEADPFKYKNIIEWRCRECNDTFETLRGGHL
jgi:hypothetical protein